MGTKWVQNSRQPWQHTRCDVRVRFGGPNRTAFKPFGFGPGDSPRLTICRDCASSGRPPSIARVLYTPARHEALAHRRFSEAAAREAIAHIAARAEQELDA